MRNYGWIWRGILWIGRGSGVGDFFWGFVGGGGGGLGVDFGIVGIFLGVCWVGSEFWIWGIFWWIGRGFVGEGGLNWEFGACVKLGGLWEGTPPLGKGRVIFYFYHISLSSMDILMCLVYFYSVNFLI